MGIGARAGEHESLAGPGAGDVTVKPFVTQPTAVVRAEAGAVGDEHVAFDLVEQRILLRRGREYAFVQAEDEREF